MKKLIIFLSLSLLVLPIIAQAATPASPLDKLMEEAALSGRVLEFKGESGTTYKAFPDYGLSKCRNVHGVVWQESKIVESKIREFCNRDFRLNAPYSPAHAGHLGR